MDVTLALYVRVRNRTNINLARQRRILVPQSLLCNVPEKAGLLSWQS